MTRNPLIIPIDSILILKGTKLRFKILEGMVNNTYMGREEKYTLREILLKDHNFPLSDLTLDLSTIQDRFEIAPPNSIRFIEGLE